MLEMYKKLVLENYANFNGRARRKEYWMFGLLNILIYLLLNVLSFIPGVGIVFSIIAGIFILGVMIPSIAVAIRRMHDVGKSGWYLFIPIYSLILACTEGEHKTNEYGADPKNGFEEMSEIGKDLN
ncbi:cytochrome [Flavobacterium sp. Root935]|jgi:uncharacterized membrane protein YhaH (DUF805 family)|uniref:DUF805 domain-containing protein n=1 Tax=Flavobacterium sp. Root935 TaxID=1736610 RepID=UPI00070ACA53|nr:DUF805 domain-containing protein [Flavobacterium sp. Root935]KRD62728.1 cytochrome [Flavobacterium sp. Root935]